VVLVLCTVVAVRVRGSLSPVDGADGLGDPEVRTYAGVMCTYVTEHVDIAGSGKGAPAWFALTRAMVYVDHPQHAPYQHTVNIDFLNPDQGPAARVAVELTEEAARALVDAIGAALASAPAGLASGRQPH
jgi:hypothetical protein